MNISQDSRFIYPPSIVCSNRRTLIFLKIIVFSYNFAAKFILNFCILQHFVNFQSIAIVRLILDITYDHIFSYRLRLVSFKQGVDSISVCQTEKASSLCNLNWRAGRKTHGANTDVNNQPSNSDFEQLKYESSLDRCFW